MDSMDTGTHSASSWRIRECTGNDIDILVETIRSAFGEVARRLGLNERNCPTHASNCRADWIEKDMGRGIRYFIFETDSGAAGSVALEHVRPGLCNLERLAVLPAYQRRGIGKALVEHVLSESEKLGCRDVRIGIIASELGLKAWYERLGFVETETRDFAQLPFRVTFMIRTMGGSEAAGASRIARR